MNIHEHQAKALLSKFDVPVARGVAISTISDAPEAIDLMPGPVWVVKSQIHAGGRGKGKFKELSDEAKGGVRVCFSAVEALDSVSEMLGKTLVTKQTGPEGKQVNQLYIEEGADIKSELYLSILVDRSTGKTSFVVSTEGGMDIEAVAEDSPDLIHTVAVEADIGCSEEVAGRVAQALGLNGSAYEQGLKLFQNLSHLLLQ